MRLWSLHPGYLDRQGLVALWRESLLAQKVLLGQTQGYRHHPQLQRFRLHPRPVAAIATYLLAIEREAKSRGYHFDRSKIVHELTRRKLSVASGQIAFEREHLAGKLKLRNPGLLSRLPDTGLEPHPLFCIETGPVEDWEVL